MQRTTPRVLPRSMPRPWQRLLLCYRYMLLGLVVLLLAGCAGRQGGTLGEHRNVLAIILLDWPERLYPGLVLSASASANLPTAQTTAPRVCEPRGAVAVRSVLSAISDRWL